MSTDWRARAACGDVDPELFFPTAVSGPVFEVQVAAAKRVCAGCPIRAECLAYAVEALADGVAGGLTAEERRGLGTRREVAFDPATGTRRERAAAGRAELAAGRPVAEVAWEFGVTERTAWRWATEVRRERRRQGQERRGAA